MADHHRREMTRAAAAAAFSSMYSGVQQASHGGGGGGDWWKWNAAAPEQSPVSSSLAAAGSSVTFQDPGGAGPACGDIGAAAAQTVAGAGLAAGWNQPFLDVSGFHGGYMSSRSDHPQICNPPSMMSPAASNSSMMLQQDQHDQNYHFLSSLGFELLSSPASSPHGGGNGSRGPASSLLRSLTEPSASAAAAAAALKPDSPGFQQYQPASSTMSQSPGAAACREPLQFTNNTTYWNNPSAGFSAAPPPPAAASLASKNSLEGVGDSCSIVTKKANTDTKRPPKKARTGVPASPLPTFKVRKEKLGDRITALQQLVSPFGKTDTASVLHETIEYIKFLHDQVAAHSAPYLKNRQQQVLPHLKSSTGKSGDGRDGGGGEKRDLAGRGLCLVPIPTTFAVASETPVVDFWNPFSAAFR